LSCITHLCAKEKHVFYMPGTCITLNFLKSEVECDLRNVSRSVPGSWNRLHSIHLNILERTCCDRHISWIMLIVSHTMYFLYFFMNWAQDLQDATYNYISYCNEKSFKLVYSLYRNVNAAICFNIW